MPPTLLGCFGKVLFPDLAYPTYDVGPRLAGCKAGRRTDATRWFRREARPSNERGMTRCVGRRDGWLVNQDVPEVPVRSHRR